MRHLAGLSDIRAEDLERLGDETGNPTVLASAGLPVPAAFVVCNRFLEETGPGDRIMGCLAGLDPSDGQGVDATAGMIQWVISSPPLPPSIAGDAAASATRLGGLLDVRSSAVVGLGDRLATGESDADRFVVSREGRMMELRSIGSEPVISEEGAMTRIGEELEKPFSSPQHAEWTMGADGVIDDPEDVFLLHLEELFRLPREGSEAGHYSEGGGRHAEP